MHPHPCMHAHLCGAERPAGDAEAAAAALADCTKNIAARRAEAEAAWGVARDESLTIEGLSIVAHPAAVGSGAGAAKGR